MEVILHLGAHRTASTALQKTLGANGPRLGAAGIAYWGPKCTRSGLFRGLLARPGAEGREMRDAASLRVARRLRAVARAGAGTLLVSEENMLGTMRGALGGRGFYAQAGLRVAALARPFAGAELTLALSVRSLDDWWVSANAFQGGSLSGEALGALALRSGTWRDVIEDVAGAVPGARVAVWRHEAMAGCPEAVIERLTGVRVPPTPGGLHRNAAQADLRVALEPRVRDALRERHADDLTWLCAGADGLAEMIDAGPGGEIPAGTGQGRGRSDDGKFREQGRRKRRLA